VPAPKLKPIGFKAHKITLNSIIGVLVIQLQAGRIIIFYNNFKVLI
jgi:hypothetical protein